MKDNLIALAPFVGTLLAGGGLAQAKSRFS